jgi:hypothetical protein
MTPRITYDLSDKDFHVKMREKCIFIASHKCPIKSQHDITAHIPIKPQSMKINLINCGLKSSLKTQPHASIPE